MPPGMLRAAYYAPFLVHLKLTPDQVDELPADIAPHLLEACAVYREASGGGGCACQLG